jgi:ketosteroid isomerase-like protein
VSENADRLEAALEAAFPLDEDIVAAARNPERIERLREVLERIAADDFVTEMVGDQSFRRERQGVDGFIESWLDWVQPFAEFRVQIEDMIDTGEHVLFFVRQIGVPHGAAAQVENEGAAVWTFEDGTVARVEFHLDRDAARRAAGLA